MVFEVVVFIKKYLSYLKLFRVLLDEWDEEYEEVNVGRFGLYGRNEFYCCFFFLCEGEYFDVFVYCDLENIFF